MKRVSGALFVAILFIGFGCVIRTEHKIDAHITVDIRHIEQQADEILDFIEGKSETLPTEEAAPQSSIRPLIRQACDFLSSVTTAHAQELKSSTTPRMKELATKMKDRQPQIDALKKSKSVGESNRGYLALRDSDEMKDTEKKNAAQKLITEENADRKALYQEIARDNSDQASVTLATVERIYAQRRLERAAAGDIFQLPPAGKDFDDFAASATGKKLGDECKAEAWVEIK
ncbi:MAG: hypothetical protein AMXMBFR84_34580 [Candidatus Hydrogenedentota bacterium]